MHKSTCILLPYIINHSLPLEVTTILYLGFIIPLCVYVYIYIPKLYIVYFCLFLELYVIESYNM